MVVLPAAVAIPTQAPTNCCWPSSLQSIAPEVNTQHGVKADIVVKGEVNSCGLKPAYVALNT